MQQLLVLNQVNTEEEAVFFFELATNMVGACDNGTTIRNGLESIRAASPQLVVLFENDHGPQTNCVYNSTVETPLVVSTCEEATSRRQQQRICCCTS